MAFDCSSTCPLLSCYFIQFVWSYLHINPSLSIVKLKARTFERSFESYTTIITCIQLFANPRFPVVYVQCNIVVCFEISPYCEVTLNLSSFFRLKSTPTISKAIFLIRVELKVIFLHYANMSVQYTANCNGCKYDNLQFKYLDIFYISSSKNRLWVHVITASIRRF